MVDFLESLTGLDKLYVEGDQALKAVDWEEEEGLCSSRESFFGIMMAFLFSSH